MRKRIDLVFFDAGGGHRSAATALKQVMEQQGRDWEVRLVNLQELLAPLDFFRTMTGVAAEDVYNEALKRGWTLGSPALLTVIQAVIRYYHSRQVGILREFWLQSRPDLVVSVIPNFNRALFESLQRSLPDTPMVTILTDMADYPPHFWMERQPQYFICGTEHAAAQARAMGHPPSRIFETSGMILHPRFYEPMLQDRITERERAGLDPALPAGLILFGGNGSKAMLGIAKRLGNSGIPLQLIALCGHNGNLAKRIEDLRLPIKIHVQRFTREVPRFMHMADFFIGKPGPASISEALAMKLPVIVERNHWTMPQERYNTEWIREKGVGLVVKTFKKIVPAVEELLIPDNFTRFRAAAANQNNQAIFEIPEILSRIFQRQAYLRVQHGLRTS